MQKQKKLLNMHKKSWKKKWKYVKQGKVKIEKKKCEHKKNLKNENYFVFNGMFNFLRGKPEITHAFSHSYLPFPYFFGHVMHFCKYPWATLIDTYHKFLQTFSSVVAYWQAFENAWPKQMPWKFSSKLNISKLTIDFRVVVIMFKLDPASLT